MIIGGSLANMSHMEYTFSKRRQGQGNQHPLTEQELHLARDFKTYSKYVDMAFRHAAGLKDGNADEDLWHELKALRKCPEFRESFQNIMHHTGLLTADALYYLCITNLPDFNLPRQRFSFDAASNSITLGIGSEIRLGNALFEVGSNFILFRHGTTQGVPQGAVGALMNLIHIVTSGSGGFWGSGASDGVWLQKNSEAKNLLRELGVDLSRDFIINGVAFEVRGGTVQTKGFTSQPIVEVDRFAHLRGLVTRAYEANLRL